MAGRLPSPKQLTEFLLPEYNIVSESRFWQLLWQQVNDDPLPETVAQVKELLRQRSYIAAIIIKHSTKLFDACRQSADSLTRAVAQYVASPEPYYSPREALFLRESISAVNLPLEIIATIMQHLSLHDRQQLRQASRYFYLAGRMQHRSSLLTQRQTYVAGRIPQLLSEYILVRFIAPSKWGKTRTVLVSLIEMLRARKDCRATPVYYTDPQNVGRVVEELMNLLQDEFYLCDGQQTAGKLAFLIPSLGATQRSLFDLGSPCDCIILASNTLNFSHLSLPGLRQRAIYTTPLVAYKPPFAVYDCDSCRRFTPFYECHRTLGTSVLCVLEPASQVPDRLGGSTLRVRVDERARVSGLHFLQSGAAWDSERVSVRTIYFLEAVYVAHRRPGSWVIVTDKRIITWRERNYIRKSRSRVLLSSGEKVELKELLRVYSLYEDKMELKLFAEAKMHKVIYLSRSCAAIPHPLLPLLEGLMLLTPSQEEKLTYVLPANADIEVRVFVDTLRDAIDALVRTADVSRLRKAVPGLLNIRGSYSGGCVIDKKRLQLVKIARERDYKLNQEELFIIFSLKAAERMSEALIDRFRTIGLFSEQLGTSHSITKRMRSIAVHRGSQLRRKGAEFSDFREMLLWHAADMQ